ncbi:hypothetical protein HYH03_004702 [Edaphochlamys debaryana]|uniref:Uncharacterized protein n=1 Tax=Edaphochlamys debaryana TaxID=47281 RepID=A0A836C1N7_9CHLO|nr:hypothetical protein HYH03_004702 [Edaphochlamys debaryana]|eukprot:KAG2497111.1 hypothetical protein HYH03_004702 [Edaphochlamys debaryana]
MAGQAEAHGQSENITVFWPNRTGRSASSAYVKKDYPKLSPAQLQQRLIREKYYRVLPVDAAPAQLLQFEDCADGALDVEDVELRDGMRLAVVVNAAASTPAEEQLKAMTGWQQGRTAADEYKAAEWATERVAGDEAPSGRGVAIEVDGMAYSRERVVLVERKPLIALEHVKELALKAQNLKVLVQLGAANTGMLRDPATGQIKRLEVFLMADGWVVNPDEVAACSVSMQEYGIEPVLPTGSGYAAGAAAALRLRRRVAAGAGAANSAVRAGRGASGGLQPSARSAPAFAPAPRVTLGSQRPLVLACRPPHVRRLQAANGPKAEPVAEGSGGSGAEGSDGSEGSRREGSGSE